MKKVNKIQERYLRLMTNNDELSYEVSSPMTGVYKCLNGFSPDIMSDILIVSKHGYIT